MTKQHKLIIKGGTPLTGVVRLGGAKNASYKLMIAALAGSGKSRLLNLPDIEDVKMVAKIIQELGGRAWSAGPKTLFIDPCKIQTAQVNGGYGEISRASSLFVAPLLAKFKQAVVPLPGGDKIGKRPLGRHLEGLEKMGVDWRIEGEWLKLNAKRLSGTTYRFEKNTHTGTETLLMVASMAKGRN